MRLYFLRHTEAELGGTNSDFERRLSPQGKDDALCAAQAIRKLGLPLVGILTSPLVRARETATIVADEYPGIRLQETGFLAPDADPRSLLAELNHYSRDSHLLLVGHEPFISKCIGDLVSPAAGLKLSMGKGALAAVEISAVAQRGGGVLLSLLTNTQLRSMCGR